MGSRKLDEKSIIVLARPKTAKDDAGKPEQRQDYEYDQQATDTTRKSSDAETGSSSTDEVHITRRAWEEIRPVLTGSQPSKDQNRSDHNHTPPEPPKASDDVPDENVRITLERPVPQVWEVVDVTTGQKYLEVDGKYYRKVTREEKEVLDRNLREKLDEQMNEQR